MLYCNEKFHLNISILLLLLCCSLCDIRNSQFTQITIIIHKFLLCPYRLSLLCAVAGERLSRAKAKLSSHCQQPPTKVELEWSRAHSEAIMGTFHVVVGRQWNFCSQRNDFTSSLNFYDARSRSTSFCDLYALA